MLLPAMNTWSILHYIVLGLQKITTLNSNVLIFYHSFTSLQDYFILYNVDNT
jgi:hypothetical protein